MTEALVRLVLLGEPRTIHVEELDPVESQVTGKGLRQIRFTTTIQGDENHDRFLSEVSDARSRQSPIIDEEGGEWQTKQSSYSYRENNGSRYSHTVELEEADHSSLSAIRFGNIEVHPERWRIDTSEEERFIVVSTSSLDADESEKLEDFIDNHASTADETYFEVNLDGNIRSPVSMRFGQCLWQPLEDGSVRHNIVLVSEMGDDERSHGILQPERTRMAEHAVNTAARLNALIEDLTRTGALSQHAAAKIAEVTAPLRAQREFDRADNVGEFFD